ncbi:hypothetical protein QE152_g35970 [Popillia japonica]|uniref:Uncharacterized protein n=1 Tax=Popillia japonica TaxID=7064 RepID=A0AAW1IEG5_POPJA
MPESSICERRKLSLTPSFEHQRSQREQWEIRQLDHDLLQQRQSEREREREQKELADQRQSVTDDQDELSLQSM